MKKLFLFIIASLLLFSCKDDMTISNSPSIVTLKVFKDGVDISYQTDDYKDNVLAGTLKIEIVPEIGEPFSITSDSTSYNIFAVMQLPLLGNVGYVCNEPNCRKYFSDIEPEVFTMIVKNNEQELFNKKLKIQYKEGNPFPNIVEVSVWNFSTEEWEKYRSSKLPILDDYGNSTGYELQIPLWEDNY
ncbi:hypothetical protein AB4865_02885 [Capnocytophaga sp. ARDL2]|uniref:hypothetical protein n=1 Tax=Capnocytophaga sp. ARDL2 TaxID=3238809 RepID=UPI003557DB80